MAATSSAEDRKPTLKELQKFVVPHASEIWEDLGIELELDDDGTTLDNIQKKRAGNASKCCLDVVKTWLQGAGVQPKTWRALVKHLGAVGADAAIASIQENILIQSGGTNSTTEVGTTSVSGGPSTGDFMAVTQRTTLVPVSEQTAVLESPPVEAGAATQQSEQLEGALSVDQETGLVQSEASNSHPMASSVGLASEVTQPLHPDTVVARQPEPDPPLTTTEQGDLQPSFAVAEEDTNQWQDDRLRENLTPDTTTTVIQARGKQEHVEVVPQSPATDTQSSTEVAAKLTFESKDNESDSSSQPSSPKKRRTADQLDFSVELKPGQQVRSYQRELATPGINGENYIICAPTGTGKTLVAALVMSDHLQKRQGNGRVVFIVDKKPLARQQTEAFKEHIPNALVKCSTGDDLGMTIKTVLPEHDIVVCTAGKLLNELKEDRVRFSEISLVVIDECHHTTKESPHAKVMEKYLEDKQNGDGEDLPQVIGLTASPGAGENPTLEVDITIQHLISLCALMDATSGIKTVEKHRDELDRHTNKPDCSLITQKHRDREEAFIKLVSKEMAALEGLAGLNCSFHKWTQKYESAIQQKLKTLQDSSDPTNRDKISVLELLRCYSRTLEFYMELRYKDAVSVLEGFDDLPPMEKASALEQKLIRSREELMFNLATLPKVDNPLLIGVQEILVQNYSSKPDSKVIIFVRTKRHCSSMLEWASSLPQELGIKPQIVTGHTRETGMGMTQAEQELALKSFHDSACNLLISTSVAEEGLDVPACNVVIRFQHVSNEIAKVQTRGRARAAESVSFTILSSDTPKTIQEIRNGELEALVDEILLSGKNSCFPRGRLLREEVLAKQEEIIRKRKFQKQFVALRGQNERKKLPANNFQLKCKKCKTPVCLGSDVYTLENATQFVVPDDKFRNEKITVKPRQSPKQITQTMTITELIHCASCDAAWGNMCTWPSRGYTLPVLKCKGFIFELDGKPQAVKKWSDAPFEIQPLSCHPAYQETQGSDYEDEATGTDY